MTRPILFLDVDGVLNSEAWFTACAEINRLAVFPRGHLDPAALARVNAIVDRSGCEVVVSSVWRLNRTVDELRALLGVRGIVDRTPEIIGETIVINGRTYHNTPRGHEIAAWLAEHRPERPPIAILDDYDDMADLRPWLVQTDAAVGVTDADVERAIGMLRPERTP